MRFIHTADIHLDSPLKGLSAYADAPAQALRSATREAFANLVGEAIELVVDFMVIAGDLYDGNWKDFNTGIYFARQMGRLRAAGIPVYLLLGNHDAENEMTRRLELPDNVYRFPSARAGSFRIPELRVALHGQSFREAATTANIVQGYPPPVEGWLNIGVLHTALEGGTVHANYAPCSRAELEARGYQYWALGHVHEHRVWNGACTIAFPGNLQGRHIREPGARGALLVETDGAGIRSVQRLLVDVLRWHLLTVDASPAQDLAAVVRAAGQALADLAASEGSSRPLAVRVVMAGASAAHGQLFGLEQQLRAEVLAQAAALSDGQVWIEKVEVATQPQASVQHAEQRADALADLQALLAGAPADAELAASLQAELMQMIGRLPREVVEALPLLADIQAGRVQELIAATAPALLACVAGAGAG